MIHVHFTSFEWERVARADDAERWAHITVEVAYVAEAEPAGVVFHYSAGD